VPVLRHRLIVWFLVASLALPAAPGFGQEEEGGMRRIGGLTFVDEVELTIANLIVYVTDKKGRAITDLAEDDFQVYQDGDLKQITNFKLYTDEIIRTEYEELADLGTPQASPEAEATVASGPQPVHLVLYIDNQNLDPLDRNRVLSQAREFVRNHLHPPAQMMVVAYQRTFEVLQEFTSDPAEVLRALRVVRTYTGGRSSHDSTRRDIADRIKQIISETRASTATQRGRQSGQRAGEWSEVYSMVENFARESINDLHFTFDALRQIITSLSGLPGKKGIIYVSNGLPMVPGIELFYEVSKYTGDSSVLTNMFEFDRSRDYRQLAASANSQGVTFYTVDASGLSMDTMGSAEYMTDSDPMIISIGRNNYIDSQRLLADETGGMAIFNTNDIAPRLELVAQDMFTYYSIGYPLQASGQDKVHKVKVKLRDDPAFANYQIRYRPRFVEKSLETRVQDRVVSSLVFDIDENPMDLEVETGTPATASANRWLLPTRISFPLNTVALLPEGEDYVARVVLFIAARDTDGKKSDLVRQTHEIRVPAAQYEEAQNERFAIDARLLMESGRYKVSTALLDPLTRQVSYKTVSASVHPKK
jgi:VWFA-related protein